MFRKIVVGLVLVCAGCAHEPAALRPHETIAAEHVYLPDPNTRNVRIIMPRIDGMLEDSFRHQGDRLEVTSTPFRG